MHNILQYTCLSDLYLFGICMLYDLNLSLGFSLLESMNVFLIHTVDNEMYKTSVRIYDVLLCSPARCCCCSSADW